MTPDADDQYRTLGDQYRSLAEDYHWLVPEGRPEAEAVLERHGHRLASSSDPAILDCACGVGADAVALARRGFRVWGSDGSEAMVAEARAAVAGAGVDVPLQVCRWDDLPGSFDRRFDLVLCLGNSVSHLPADAMVEALRGMAGVLADGGLLVVNARNWERLRDRRPRLTFPERMLEREGRRCLPFYIWSFEPGWGVTQRVEIVFLLETDGRVEMRGHKLTCWPFRLAELRERLSSAGLTVVADTYDPDADWYEVVAEKAEPRPAG